MKFFSKPIAEHAEVPPADGGCWERLVDHWRRQDRPATTKNATGSNNDCYVVCVVRRQQMANRQAQLAEMLKLVAAQGDSVVGSEVYELTSPDPRTLVRRGVAAELGARANVRGANLLVVDAELTPSQLRNLEDSAGVAVCDREAVILNVFLRHARTRRARIQVEIAHLEYLRPRIRGLGLDMDQQAGGVMRGRGPGETESELMARHLDSRLTELRRRLGRLTMASHTQRRGRCTSKRIALVGYTNAGKTSLMNALVDSGLSAKNMPFETLDTTTRCLTRDGTDVLLSDTVGFIRRLPPRLLASFESTLAELREASLVALVIDLADPECEMHLQITEELLTKIGAGDVPRFYIFNKLDLVVEPPSARWLRRLARGSAAKTLSAHDPEAVAELKQALLDAVRKDLLRARVFVPYHARELLCQLYARCRVMETTAEQSGLQLRIEGSPQDVSRIERASRKVV